MKVKVLMAVVASAAVAAAGTAGLVVEAPVQRPTEDPVTIDAATRTIRLFTSSEQPLVPKPHHVYGVRKLLKGTLVVAFEDPTNGRMNAYLLPNGLEHIDFSDEELRPLVQFMLNGRKKAFLCLDAGSYLGLPEMSMPLKKIHTPHDYNFSNYLPISINPYVMLVEYDSISGNSRFGSLKELAVFSVEREGLALVRDNYPQLFQG